MTATKSDREAEVKLIRETMEKFAKRVNLRFVVDPAKLEEFVSVGSEPEEASHAFSERDDNKPPMGLI